MTLSYSTYNDPPSYAVAIPSPDYSQAPLPCEELVETSLVPPPYPLTRLLSSASSLSSFDSASDGSSSRRYSVEEYSARSRSRSSNSNSTRPSTSSSAASSSSNSSSSNAQTAQTTSSISGGVVPAAATASSSSSPAERYITRVGSIELDLGPRRETDQGAAAGAASSSFPTYGLNGHIRGEVRLKKMSHVQAIVVSLEGRVQSMVIHGGVPSGHTDRKILDVPKAIYTAAFDKAKTKASSAPWIFPFEFQFPSTIQQIQIQQGGGSSQDGDEELLPPTFRAAHPSMEGSVKYTIKVQVIKTGLWLRESLSTVIHYLPKFYLQPEALLWPAISLMDAKRFGLESNDKWRTSSAHLLYTPSSFKRGAIAPPELSVSIPRTAQAVAYSCFPVNVTVRLPGFSQEEMDAIVSNPERLSITMIKRTTLVANNGGGQKSSHVVGIGSAQQQQIEKELVKRPGEERIVRVWFKAGTKYGEASWRINNLIEVQYFIRVALSLQNGQAPIFRHEEEIQMFSHSREQFENPFEAHDAPAPALLLASSLGRAI
ncbi:hypothetical protein FRC14_001638 [Serendipita sp. 396]|nr:hypothetical protein FRC14_001638 [Serendipita sp. 396]KAG8774329.1 hypothetical protein FRC15_001362 [Serendipita sp. 397]KAG8788703.1 hypothetical protein FRC16_001321 [Serendipita sp. 398]KAG8851706.1 hypothetical protein FRC20_001671 [Serendipita sp. 405]